MTIAATNNATFSTRRCFATRPQLYVIVALGATSGVTTLGATWAWADMTFLIGQTSLAFLS